MNTAIAVASEVTEVGQNLRRIQDLARSVMTEGIDYGVIPGTPKPTLFQSGAEQIRMLFGLRVDLRLNRSIEDWTGKDYGAPLFYYTFTADVYDSAGNILLKGVEASANSWEGKWGWRWVPEHEVPGNLDINKLEKRDDTISELQFAIESKKTSGQYGKPAEYWQQFQDAIDAGTAVEGKRKVRSGKEMKTWEIGGIKYRVPNPGIFDIINTIIQMAQKRTFVRAIRQATGASKIFTQDLENDVWGAVIDAEYQVIEQELWLTWKTRQDMMDWALAQVEFGPDGKAIFKNAGALTTALKEVYDAAGQPQQMTDDFAERWYLYVNNLRWASILPSEEPK